MQAKYEVHEGIVCRQPDFTEASSNHSLILTAQVINMLSRKTRAVGCLHLSHKS